MSTERPTVARSSEPTWRKVSTIDWANDRDSSALRPRRGVNSTTWAITDGPSWDLSARYLRAARDPAAARRREVHADRWIHHSAPTAFAGDLRRASRVGRHRAAGDRTTVFSHVADHRAVDHHADDHHVVDRFLAGRREADGPTTAVCPVDDRLGAGRRGVAGPST